MAAARRVDLHHLHAAGADTVRVLRGKEIALDHGDSHLPGQRAKRCLHQRRLAGAGRPHQVQHENTARREIRLHRIRQRVVLSEDILHHIYFHSITPSPNTLPEARVR